jgi:lipid II:glycine glycyltransferase (peptidoglycan interpeptide bridge formation enzyme)
MVSWREIGALPQKVRHLDAKFNKVLDNAYKKLNISKADADYLRFESSMNSLVDQNNARKLDGEQLFIRRKMDELTREIKQLENNISFISNASEDNPLVKNVYKNIEDLKKEFEIWKRKISFMKKLDY